MIKKINILNLFVSFSFLMYGQNIDLTNWKVTLPITKENGKLVELEHPEIQDFEKNKIVEPFFYRDPKDGAIVFRAYPANTTKNTKYSRTELREQMQPGSNSVNWTFEQGGIMRGTLSVPEVTQDKVGKYHRVIIMQIHGRLTNEQRDLIGEDDNNAPPILKIYWEEGKIRVKTKVLKDVNASDEEILHEHAWGDDKGRNFKKIVGTDKFTLEVNVSKGLMEITLNDDETFVYDGVDMERWGIFENYFKAGNYFQSRDEGSYGIVKYYDLQVTHSPDKIINRENLLTEKVSNDNIRSSNKFDLNNWKLETPSGYKASAWKLSNFQSDKFVKPFFYLNDADNALVMEAYPSKGTSTARYTRNTLREQMQPGSNDINWTMKQGGVLEAEFQIEKMSKKASGEYHRTILFQIDGRTTEKQTKQLGLPKPTSMPFLKIYWQNEMLVVKRRVLKDEETVGDALLDKASWQEEKKGTYSREKIGFDKVNLRIEVKKNKIIILINEEKPIVFSDFSVSQWYFENYFTVGNYLQSKDDNCHSIVKFYKLNLEHPNKK